MTKEEMSEAKKLLGFHEKLLDKSLRDYQTSLDNMAALSADRSLQTAAFHASIVAALRLRQS